MAQFITEGTPERLVQLVERTWSNEASWARVPPTALHDCLVAKLAEHAEDPSDKLFRLYSTAVRRLSIPARQGALETLTSLVEDHGLTPIALFPFLVADPDPSIASTAALNLAVLIPADEEDPLHGPRFVRKLADDSEEPVRAHILLGLLTLGDRRVLPLLDRAWEPLSREGRRVFANVRSVVLHAPVIDYLLGWLGESDDPEDQGAICGTLARFGRAGGPATPGVVEARRKLPANGPGDEPPITLLRRWTVEEYAERMEPALRRAAEREAATEYRHVPFVLSAWGLDATPTVIC